LPATTSTLSSTEGAPRQRLAGAALLVLLAAAVLHVATAAIPDIYDELPGQYAGTAREMVESGNWLVPTLAGIPRLQKPPLVYWITALSLRLLGTNEFAARLPTALALVGLMVVTHALGARLYGRGAGLVASGILGTSFGTVALGKLIMPEPFLALGIALSLYLVLRCAEDPGRGPLWALAAWGATALATLSKGLHGFLLPAAIVVVVLVLSPESRRPLAALARPRGPALFLLLVLPWPLYIESGFPGYLWDNLLNEQLGHLMDTHFPRDSDATPVVLFWSQHLVWWFPWVLFVPAAVGNSAPGSRQVFSLLPLVWFVTTSIAASLSGQRQDYHTMFAWPAFALLVSRAWRDGSARRPAKLALALPLLALLVLGALALAAYVATRAEAPQVSGVSAPFGSRNSVVGVITGVAGVEWRRLRWLLVPAGGGLLLGAGAGLALTLRSSTRRWSWVPVAAGTLGMLLAAVAGLQAFAPFFSLKALAVALDREGARGESVMYDGPGHRASSLCFYSGVPLKWIERAETEFAVRSRRVGRDRFVGEEEVIARWRAGDPVWLITEENRLELWRSRLGGTLLPIVARSGTRVLLANRATRSGSR
jgi:4-amino-4-deoxy-L-arabinose transferase-like glycosyltransferase